MHGNHHPNTPTASNLSPSSHYNDSAENSELNHPVRTESGAPAASPTREPSRRSSGEASAQKSRAQEPVQAVLFQDSLDFGDHPMTDSLPQRAGAVGRRSTTDELSVDEEAIDEDAEMVNKQLAALGLTDADLSAQGNAGPQESDHARIVHHSTDEYGLAAAKQVWRNALSDLAMHMPPATYDTWMKDTEVIGYEDGEFIIGAPNAYACDWLKGKLRTQIKRTLCHLLQRKSVQVTFSVSPVMVDDSASGSPAPLYDTQAHGTRVGDEQVANQHASNGAHGSSNGQTNSPLFNNGVGNPADGASNGGGNPNGLSQAGESYNNGMPSPSGQANGYSVNGYQTNGQMSGRQTNGYQANRGYTNSEPDGFVSITLNPLHTFDTFVVGKHNRMAHAAAEGIADMPGASFNPLFVYGGVGLGKTHLLHAIGNRAVQNGYRILYCTSEQFTNELILSIRKQNTEYFRNKYRQVDILLIDDIQFIAGKESTQEEFFHTFNHLHAAGKQVILSSDRPPKSLQTLEERLRSRFEGGLQTDISKPDFETRVAILQSKAATAGMAIEPAALMLIAERVDSNIRELEGALNQILLKAQFFSNKLDVALTESVLESLAPVRTMRTPTAIIEAVAEHYQLTVEDLTGRSRTKNIAHARQMAMYLLREENAMSLPSIGDHLGGRDHSTVRHGVEKVTTDIASDDNVRYQIVTLREKIYAAPGIR